MRNNLAEELLVAHCVDYLLEHGGIEFLNLILEIKEKATEKHSHYDRSMHFMISDEPVSLDQVSEGGTTFLEMIPDPGKLPEDIAQEASLRRFVSTLTATLTTQEQRVIDLRFGLHGNARKTLEEVGAEFNVTRERIRQIEVMALEKLRRKMRINEIPREIF